MKGYLSIVLMFISTFLFSQQITNYETSPVFPECDSVAVAELKTCFTKTLNQYIFKTFKVPDIVSNKQYKGDVKVLFEVDKEGVFKVLHVDAAYNQLKDETKRVFDSLPQIKPGNYNSKPTFYQYSLAIKIPLVDPSNASLNASEEDNTQKPVKGIVDLNETVSKELESLEKSLVKYEKLEYKSPLNIPFTHNYYTRFDAQMNALGTNSHTAAKPFLYSEVSKYYDFVAEKESRKKEADNWWTRKLWNEHMVEVQGKDFWFTVDPVFDFQVGKDTDADFSSTFNNTRGVFIQGALGKRFSFSTSVFESQGRSAQYYNRYAESLGKPNSDTEVAVVPGRGIAKRFKSDAYDYPIAEAYLSFKASKHVNIQFGHGKNFIGDGYRTLLQGDVATPHTFLKLNTTFWKIKYTNTWMWLRDIRPEVEEDGAFLTKYMANHYLSWNVSKRLNLGFFESVMWVDANGRGFDINYLNPVIFYRAIEFETGQDAGNAILGATAKYKWNNKINLYGQFILDEFSLDAVRGGNKSWKNKYGYQLGVKYFDAFNVKNLYLQAEYNQVRPYTYSHNSIVLNYAHANQSMAHLWGANFREFILIGRYNYKRWYGDAKLVFGTRGLDFNDGTDNFSYGGDLYRSEVDRPFENGVKIGQGNKTSIFHGEFQAGYIVNPVSNLKLFTNISIRNFDPNATTDTTFKNNTVWFNLGLRTDLFNWYFDL